MIYIDDISSLTKNNGTVVALGKFDGVHRGHQALLARAVGIAKEKGLSSTVLTFRGQPASLLTGSAKPVCMTGEERRFLIEHFGIDRLVEIPFDEKLRNMTAVDFVKEILLGKLCAKVVTAGDDLAFGKNRAGNADLLMSMRDDHGFECEIIPKVMDGDREISSTYVREELIKGDMEKVSSLLGFPYFISGTVERGRHVGTSLGFPTINITTPPEKLLPPNGVYASKTLIGSRMCESITNIGVRPTFGLDKVCAETFLLDFSEEIYDTEIKTLLLEHMRPEIRFDSADALKEQINADVERRRNLLSLPASDKVFNLVK